MSAQFLSGTVVAQATLNTVKEHVKILKDKGITPGLGTILVGGDAASAGYVKKKHQTCAEVGIQSFNIEIDENATQADLMNAIESFNTNEEVDSYILQYPLPKQFDFNQAMSAMLPSKDADGLHPENLGKLVLQEEGPLPCTPAGIVEILKHYNIDVSGKNVVIVGRGTTLGRPLSLLLSMKAQGCNAAVTTVHSGVADIASYTLNADIIICAVGIHNFIKPDMVKAGAVVISGGISWDGKTLLPDVAESVGEVADWITPRIGGVGPTTVAMLLKNTVLAAEKR
jgi:methylenetetrahydrofolate dehydrogenase (NADP+)/methenyltetrahydrofolate cyclohydrolase